MNGYYHHLMPLLVLCYKIMYLYRMETLIPIVVALAAFAFQAYSNFQKEQEKARKRNLGKPSAPPLPEDNAERNRGVPRAEAPRQPARSLPEPVPTYHQEYEGYSGFLDTDEVTRARASRKSMVSPLRVEIAERIGGDGGSRAVFDLRDAVIKSAILERPYQ